MFIIYIYYSENLKLSLILSFSDKKITKNKKEFDMIVIQLVNIFSHKKFYNNIPK